MVRAGQKGWVDRVCNRDGRRAGTQALVLEVSRLYQQLSHTMMKDRLMISVRMAAAVGGFVRLRYREWRYRIGCAVGRLP
jgi:hypothetical protein